MIRARRALALTAFALSVLARSAPARADDAPPPPTAHDLAKQGIARGKEQLAKGDVAAACTSFEQSVLAERSYEGLMQAAQCHELAGRTASAWQEASAASALPDASTEQQDRARELASKLAPRLSKLRVDVITPLAGQMVFKDGKPLPADAWGALLPADPGSYLITATAPDRLPFSARVEVGASADRAVVVVPALPKPGEAASPAKPVDDPAKPSDADLENPVIRNVSPLGVAAFVTTSGGIVGVTMGIVFGVMTLNEVSDAEDDPALCPKKVCSKAGRLVIDEAESKGIGSTVAFAVGGTALAAGIAMFLYKELAPDPKASDPKAAPTAPKVEPAAMGEQLGLRVHF